MNKLSRLSKSTSLALAAVFLVALAVQADYNIYAWRESGGTGGGPWFQYVGTAQSWMGGHMAYTLGGVMMLDGRTSLSSQPTTIYYQPPSPSGNCTIGGMRVPCMNEF